MKRHDAMRQRRAAAARPSVQEIDLPLPVRGLFSMAKSGKVSNLYAAEMVNLRSDGIKLGLRPSVEWGADAALVIQRVPYEFGRNPGYIEVEASKVRFGAVEFSRLFGGKAVSAAISSSVLLVDGFGLPVRFNGTAFNECAFTVSTTENPARFTGIVTHHDRVFLWRRGKLEFYYGDVGAVQGPLSRFPLDRLGNISGSIVAMLSLTVDAGHGMNDIMCIITSAGQLVLYEGLDPGDASDWRLTGIIQAGVPLGDDAFCEVGSDVWMLTRQGVVSLGDSIRASVLALVSDMTIPISEQIGTLAEEGGDWSMFTALDGSMIVVNRIVGFTARQFIYYTASKSWAEGDLPARDWHNLNGVPSITGFDGRLGALKPRGADEVVTTRLVTSWFETGREVGVAWVKPTIRAKGPLSVRLVVLSDTNDTAADVAESEQTITMEPEEPGGFVTLADEIACDAVGSRFQITLEVSASWMEIISLKAAVG